MVPQKFPLHPDALSRSPVCDTPLGDQPAEKELEAHVCSVIAVHLLEDNPRLQEVRQAAEADPTYLSLVEVNL